MKQKLKKLSIVSLLLSAFVIFSCSEDYEIHDHNDNNQKFKLRTLNNQKINSNIKVVEKLQSLNKGTKKNNNSIVSRIIYNQENNFSINTDYVKYIENTETGNHSFNFQITRLDTISNKIENLVLISNSQGNYDAYIFKYNLTAQEFKSVNLNVSNSLTDIIPIDFDLNTLSTDLNSKTVYGCTETWTWVSGEHDGNELHGALWKGKCLVSGCSYNGAWVLTDISCGYHDDGTGGDATNNPTGNSTEGGGSTTNGSNSNYDGSNTSIHGNGNIIAAPVAPEEEEEIIEDDPCENLKNLSKPDKYNINPIIASLKQKVINQVKKEWGTEFIRESYYDAIAGANVVNYSTNFREGDNYDITLSGGEEYNAAGHLIKYLGGIHLHPIDGYSMFSWGDLRSLLLMHESMSNSYKPEISLLLVCYNHADPSKPHVYAIRVENIDALRNKINALWNHSDYSGITDEKKKVKSINDDTSDQYETNKNDLERFFLQNYSDYGISLYKAEDDMSNWNKKSLGTGTGSTQTIDSTPCTL